MERHPQSLFQAQKKGAEILFAPLFPSQSMLRIWPSSPQIHVAPTAIKNTALFLGSIRLYLAISSLPTHFIPLKLTSSRFLLPSQSMLHFTPGDSHCPACATEQAAAARHVCPMIMPRQRALVGAPNAPISYWLEIGEGVETALGVDALIAPLSDTKSRPSRAGFWFSGISRWGTASAYISRRLIVQQHRPPIERFAR